MSDTVRLVVGGSPVSLPIVRMVVGGVGSRLEFSLDDLEDLYLALEELFRTAFEHGEGPRQTLVMDIGDGALAITAGPFRSAALRERLTGAPPAGMAIDLRRVLAHVVESLEVCDGDGDCFSVAFRKSRGGDRE